MSFCQTRNRSTQSSNVDKRVASIFLLLRIICVRRGPGTRSMFNQRGTVDPSTAVKFWCSLFHEGPDTFTAILGMETLQLLLNFLVQSLHKFFLVPRKQVVLHRSNRHLGPIGNLLCQRFHFRLEA